MGEFPNTLPRLFIRSLRSLVAIACVFYRQGRQFLLELAKARTDLAMLAVEQKRLEIEYQRANHVIDLVQKVEKIKNPQLREKVRAAISSRSRSLPMVDDSVLLKSKFKRRKHK